MTNEGVVSMCDILNIDQVNAVIKIFAQYKNIHHPGCIEEVLTYLESQQDTFKIKASPEFIAFAFMEMAQHLSTRVPKANPSTIRGS